jgi:hypothetical protein
VPRKRFNVHLLKEAVMNRVIRYALPVAGLVLLSIGQAQAHGPHRGDRVGLVSSAHQFEEAAERMHYVLGDTLGRARVTKNARRLAHAAHDYRRAVRRGKPARYLKGKFHRLARHFDDFRQQFRHDEDLHHDRRTRRAMRWLVRSFRTLRSDTHNTLRTYRRYDEPRHWGDYEHRHRRHRQWNAEVVDNSP